VKILKLLLGNPVLFAKKLRKRASRLFLLYVLRDASTVQSAEVTRLVRAEVTRWFRDRGDENLRLDYPDLDENSVVFDLGGYKGDFAQAINEKYGCKVYLFEPHPEFFRICVDRFLLNTKVVPLNYGLSDKNGVFTLSDTADGSSFLNPNHFNAEGIECEVKEILSTLIKLGVAEIDLMKINIEGGEYPLLSHMASQSALTMVNQYQIQFHTFIDDAESMRDEIVRALSKTHDQTWCYTFVWENWKRKSSVA